jgi:hypothetical protein
MINHTENFHKQMKFDRILQKIRNIPAQGIAHPNFILAPRTSTRDIVDLMCSLHPVRTDFPLIRFGPAGDGGYLVPDDLDGITACFSPGVNLVSGFEKECALRGMDVYMADRSVEAPAESDPRFDFIKTYVGASTREGFITLDDWVSTKVNDSYSDLMLQIDIEGCEYETLLAASPALLNRFRIIVAEFHWLDHLWCHPLFQLINALIVKLLSTHHCVHLHPNNSGGSFTRNGIEIPRLMEITFLRRDRSPAIGYKTEFPDELDHPNVPKADLRLPNCWFHSE